MCYGKKSVTGSKVGATGMGILSIVVTEIITEDGTCKQRLKDGFNGSLKIRIILNVA